MNFSEVFGPSLPPLSPQLAEALMIKVEAELSKRERKRIAKEGDLIRARCRSLYGFIQEFWPILEPETRFVGGWALEAICEHLEAVTRGEITRLLINVPPGMMKSLAVAVLWPAWEWGPMGLAGMRYLSTSFSEANVIRDNAKMRRVVESEKFNMLWPEIVFARDQNSKRKFENTKTGGREGRAFTSMTGGRADRVIIDDPHSVDTAESDVERENTVLTFRESISDRLNDIEKSAIVIIMQRLHEADVSGTILALRLPYVHLCLPMEYDPARHCKTYVGGVLFFEDPRRYEGELLFPERFPQRALAALRRVKDEYAWAGQYDQRPTPREGGMFKVERIVLCDFVPAGAKRIRGWDIAGSTRKTSPYTVGFLMAEAEGVVYFENVKRERAEIDQAERLIVETAREDTVAIRQSIPQDPGSAGKSQKHHLIRRLHGLDVVFSPETGAKQDRAIPLASQVNAGNARMVRAPWNAELLSEMRNFPGSMYKDQVDAGSRAYAEIAKGLEANDEFAAPEIVVVAA